MTGREAYDIYASIWERSRDDGIISPIFSRHMNMAMIAIMKDHFFQKHNQPTPYHSPKYAFENVQYSIEAFYPLVSEIELTTDNVGRINISDIEATFPQTVIRDEVGNIETKRCPLFHINNVARYDGTGKFESARWVRHNEYRLAQRDPFLEPTERHPLWRYTDNRVVLDPGGQRAVRLSVTRHPKHMWFDENFVDQAVNPELPDHTMYDVIWRALRYAGVFIDKQNLYQGSTIEENSQ